MTAPLERSQRERTLLVMAGLYAAGAPVRTATLSRVLGISEESARVAVATLKRQRLVVREVRGHRLTPAGKAVAAKLPPPPAVPPPDGRTLPLKTEQAMLEAAPAPLTREERAAQLLGNGFSAVEVAAILRMPVGAVKGMKPTPPPEAYISPPTDAIALARAGRQAPNPNAARTYSGTSDKLHSIALP